MKRMLIPAALALVGLTAVPGKGHAQGIRLVPHVGLYAPVSDLGRVDTGDEILEVGKKETTLAYGVAADVGSRESRTGFRLDLTYATNSDVPVSGIGCTECDARSTVLTATGALVFRPIPRVVFLQPHFVAGAGGKRYDFDTEDLRERGFDDVLDDQWQFTGLAGLGFEMGLGIFTLQAEVSDYISSVELGDDEDGELQHDLFFTLGVLLGG